MSTGTGIPRGIRWTVGLGLIGLALAVPFSAPDGTGMQWDELVLATVAARTVWSIARSCGTPPWRPAPFWCTAAASRTA